MNGDRPIDSGSTPSSRCSIVAFPAATTSSTASRAMPAVAHTLPSSPSIVPTMASRSCSSASGPCICVWLTRVSTSAPKGACRLIVDSTAAAAPARRSISVATTVVVPTSIETPNSRSVVSPGSTSTRRSPITVAVIVESSSSSIAAARRGSTLAACVTSNPSTTSASVTRRSRLRGSSIVGASRVSRYLTAFGSSSTNRPTPIVAALGTVIARGTSTTMSSATSHWQDSRQPSSRPSDTWR